MTPGTGIVIAAVVGVDLSLTGTGIVTATGGRLVTTADPDERRWSTIVDAVAVVVGSYPVPTLVVLEDGSSHGTTAYRLGMLAGAVRHELWQTTVRIGEALDARGVLPSTFKCLALGSHSDWVWHDVNRMRTLNSDQARKNLTLHVCPLQFDIVDRCIARWSNPGDVVFDPFGGIGTVPVRALRAGRVGYGVELSPEYWCDGVKHIEAEASRHNIPSLFDILDYEEAAS